MSLHQIAQHLAARGRNGDSTLVHMTPGEVGGLQALALSQGGSLTINPDTGLPEANILKSILPMVAGAVLTGGMGLPAIASAALVGGGTALATKNLGQGLMAGLGAFGGAGLGGGLAKLGATGLSDAAVQSLASSGAASTADVLNAANAAANTAGGIGAPAAGATTGMGAMQAGLQRAVQDPQSFVSAMGGSKAATRAAGMAGLPALMQTTTPQPDLSQTPGAASRHPMRSPASYDYDPTARDRFRAYAQGGVASLADNPYYTMSGESGDSLAYLMGQRKTSPQVDAAMAMPAYPTKITGAKYEGLPQYTFDTTTGTFTPVAPAKEDKPAAAAPGAITPDARLEYLSGGQAAAGGLMGLAQGGRLLDGPGDGVSDSIPAKIDGQRPARLATGEFVFDARTVSEIGNGDTKAGAKKLYAVMEAIHRKRATAERGKPSGADKTLHSMLT